MVSPGAEFNALNPFSNTDGTRWLMKTLWEIGHYQQSLLLLQCFPTLFNYYAFIDRDFSYICQDVIKLTFNMLKPLIYKSCEKYSILSYKLKTFVNLQSLLLALGILPSDVHYERQWYKTLDRCLILFVQQIKIFFDFSYINSFPNTTKLHQTTSKTCKKI